MYIREYLSDIKIAQIIILDKVAVPQRRITDILKCSKKTSKAHSQIFSLTFTRCKIMRKYQRKTTEHEDRYIEHVLTLLSRYVIGRREYNVLLNTERRLAGLYIHICV